MNRTESREAAFVIAFEKHFLPEEAIEDIIADAEESCDFKVGEFTRELLDVMYSNLEAIDEIIVPNLRKWSFDRISIVCKTLLRIAVCEMVYKLSPVGVAINECVELAKHFGSEEDHQFVNGVLGSIAKALPAENE